MNTEIFQLWYRPLVECVDMTPSAQLTRPLTDDELAMLETAMWYSRDVRAAINELRERFPRLVAYVDVRAISSAAIVVTQQAIRLRDAHEKLVKRVPGA